MKKKIQLVQNVKPSMKVKTAFTFAASTMTLFALLTWLTFTYLNFGNAREVRALPLELTNFTLANTYEGVKVAWRAGGEENDETYTIELSMDGKVYEPVATLKSKNSDRSYSSYEYTDEYPLLGTTYYRLTVTDSDGKTQSLKPAAVEFTLDRPENIGSMPI